VSNSPAPQQTFKPNWRPAIVFIALFLVAVNGDLLLPALGYPFAGRPLWIFTGVMAPVLMACAFFATQNPLGLAFTGRPFLRSAYVVLALAACVALLIAMIVGVAIASLYFWVPFTIILVLAIFEWKVTKSRIPGAN
jgi:hypothetical protein